MLADVGNQVQHLLYFLFGHKARCPIGALVGVDQIALPVVFPGLAVPHPHDHKNQHSQGGNAAAHTVKAIGEAEYGGDAGKETGVRKLGGCTKGPARGLPHIIVVEELGYVTAPIEQCAQGDGQDDNELYLLFSGNMQSLQKVLAIV